MPLKTILFVTHTKKQCGVFQFGSDIFDTLIESTKYNFIKLECNSLSQLTEEVRKIEPHVIIYNYHPSVMPWLCTKISKGIYKNNIVGIGCTQIGIIHEITQQVADTATAYRNKYILGGSEKKLNSLFDFYVGADPTLLLKNPYVFKTGRLVNTFINENSAGSSFVPIIGSFGFATPNKGFEKLVLKVEEEFDEAIIRINMPSADFGDVDGNKARQIAENCKNIITKKGITLQITHDFLGDKKLAEFLAGNTVNAFFYTDKTGRGISSAIDKALGAKKPIVVSDCPMFRHILNTKPSVCIDDLSIKQVIKNGFSPLKPFVEEWNNENLIWEYERILDTIFIKGTHRKYQDKITNRIRNNFRKIFSLPERSFTWLRSTLPNDKDNFIEDSKLKYTPITLPDGPQFNIILDDKKRVLYEPVVEFLTKIVPQTMSKKIARANVQQAFVFDTVYRFMIETNASKLLCVGSYEDTASMSLVKMGYNVEEIDPMINYFLQDYYSKPTVKKSSYDIIFSTSVIEHDPDDESFIKSIEGLLAPGGIAVITCDYKDGWKVGDLKPDVDARLYTKADLEKRLLSYLPNSCLVDLPNWECPNPDFIFQEKYIYTFATFVFKKNK